MIKTVSVLVSMLVVLVASGVSGRTWYILPDGSGDTRTIQAGLDSSSVGDTVLVACGTYYESGIWMKSGVVLCSETGHADCVTIDGQGVGPVIECINLSKPTWIVGITIKNGSRWYFDGWGGGIFCTGGESHLTIQDCTFINNKADYGGGLCCQGQSLDLIGCVFSHNSAISYGGGLLRAHILPMNVVSCVFDSNSAGGCGGAMACMPAAGVLTNCTMFGNYAGSIAHGEELAGGGIYLMSEYSELTIEKTIIASSTGGEGIACERAAAPELSCCDIWGNADGDWVGCIADQCSVAGNFSRDPKFCDTPSGTFTVEDCSPCLPGHHPSGYECGGVIGAFGSGCDCGAATEPTSWGSIKAMYR